MDQAIDYGTEQRYQHGCVMVEGKDGMALDDDGQRVTRARETHECLMEWLWDKRLLSQEGDRGQEEARRRLDAGIWLRGCFHKAGLGPRGSGSYKPGGGNRSWPRPVPLDEVTDDGEERTDSETWNLRCFRDTMIDLRQYARILQSTCCYDEMPKTGQFQMLRKALDRLAELRGL